MSEHRAIHVTGLLSHANVGDTIPLNTGWCGVVMEKEDGPGVHEATLTVDVERERPDAPESDTEGDTP